MSKNCLFTHFLLVVTAAAVKATLQISTPVTDSYFFLENLPFSSFLSLLYLLCFSHQSCWQCLSLSKLLKAPQSLLIGCSSLLCV